MISDLHHEGLNTFGNISQKIEMIKWVCFNWEFMVVLTHWVLNLSMINVMSLFCCIPQNMIYRKTSNISRTLVGNKIVDNSDVVGASPVGAAPTTSSFST